MKRPQSRRSDKPVLVAGEGLVGSLLSIHLARRGFEVEVYERRPDMRKEKVEAGRSINLALSTRGLHALGQAGLTRLVMSRAIPMLGRMIHSPTGELSFQPYGKDDSEHINSISRAWLNQVLMDQAEKTGRVRIHFNRKITGVDFKTGSLRAQNNATGAVSKARGCAVLAADGAHSAVRKGMAKRSGHSWLQEPLGHGYKELTMPAGKGSRKR